MSAEQLSSGKPPRLWIWLAVGLSVFVCLCLIGVAAVSLLPPFMQRQTLEQNYAKWQANGSDNYTMTVNFYAFSPCSTGLRNISGTPMVISVEGGQVVDVQHPDPNCQQVFDFLTIEQVFEDSRTCLNNLPTAHCTIAYDPTLGYPTEAALDPGGARMADDEVTYQIISLELAGD